MNLINWKHGYDVIKGVNVCSNIRDSRGSYETNIIPLKSVHQIYTTVPTPMS